MTNRDRRFQQDQFHQQNMTQGVAKYSNYWMNTKHPLLEKCAVLPPQHIRYLSQVRLMNDYA